MAYSLKLKIHQKRYNYWGIDMQCKCGGSTSYSEHEVKTLLKAQEWDETVILEDLPVKVCKEVCTACGRQMIRKIDKPLV